MIKRFMNKVVEVALITLLLVVVVVLMAMSISHQLGIRFVIGV